LNLAAHLTEAHPDKPQGETAEEREAREQEEARQAAVAAEIVRSEAEAARRKAEARARRQAIEGPDFAGPLPGQAGAHPQASPSQQPDEQVRPADAAVQVDLPAPAGEADAGSPPHGRSHAPGDSSERGTGAEERPAGSEGEAWERLRRAYAERTILTGVVCDRKPFGVFVNLGGIEGLVRNSEMCAADAAGEASGLQRGRTVTVVVIGMREEGRRVELSMRRVGESRTPPKERGATAAAARPAEGTMALAFRLAREKKENAG
jgi:predicted RNA-binding protein with RPS1 domain